MSDGPRIEYFHRASVPGPTAGAIQILRTGAALAAAGVPFRYHAMAPVADRDAIAAAYDLDRRHDWAVTALFPRPGWTGRPRGVALPFRLARLRTEGGRAVWIARGGAADPVVDALRRGGAPVTFLYEMHNLAHVRAVERDLGRRADAADLDTDRARTAKAREARRVAAADGLVFLSDGVARAARDAFACRAPSLILPSGTDVPARLPEPSGPPVDVVYAGKLERRKGVGLLLDALRLLPGRTAALAGGPDAAASDLRDAIRAAGLDERVHVAGPLPAAEVPAFLMRGAVACCPLPAGVDRVSDEFSSPMKLLQAMGLGRPVVATGVGPVRAVASDGADALLVPPDDPHALAAGIERLLSDAPLAARLGRAACRRAGDFTWDRRAAALLDFAASLSAVRTGSR
ncbi:glycosyltransferase family 4 protein [Jannaschia sp. LMIT008]|uniref:glycosyltransferase family 4 protein n=1 Tax=Jannaschia maritima TaxID=3032585 RepID=UPI0028109C8C|nr:glycosyltransferase family 4 protein [Jannaschia sp. LMIT008]